MYRFAPNLAGRLGRGMEKTLWDPFPWKQSCHANQKTVLYGQTRTVDRYKIACDITILGGDVLETSVVSRLSGANWRCHQWLEMLPYNAITNMTSQSFRFCFIFHKNATGRWQWAHSVTAIVLCLLSSMLLHVLHMYTFRDMNYFLRFLVQSGQTDNRQTVMHMSPPCKLHRWAQKAHNVPRPGSLLGYKCTVFSVVHRGEICVWHELGLCWGKR